MASKKTRLGRWDEEVLKNCKQLFPKTNTAEISRILYNTSMIKLEQDVRNWNSRLEVKFGIKKPTKKK